MKKASTLILMFVLGFLACGITVKWLEAQRDTRILSRGDVQVVRALQQTPKGEVLPSTQLTLAAESAIESVVNIDTTQIVERPSDPFGFFSQKYRAQGAGSGVIISADGYVMTNNHVAGDAETIRVTLHDGRTYPAKLVGRDEDSDIAVVKIEATDLQPVKLGNSDSLRVADIVLAIGNPYGFGGTVTMGVVSAAKRRAIKIENTVLAEAIQTDASINPGNSGGALVNTKGELIGINTFIVSQSGGSVGLGFAIPINSAREVAAELIKSGSVPKPWLGAMDILDVSSMSEAYRRYLAQAGWDYKGDKGVLIRRIQNNGPFDKSGVRPGDVVVKIGKEEVNDEAGFVLAERKQEVGGIARVVLVRDGKEKTIDVNVEERPKNITYGGGG